MKPFNLEEAKAGKPFGRFYPLSGIEPREFVGEFPSGRIGYRRPDGFLDSADPRDLRMIETPVVKWVNIYRESNGELVLGKVWDTEVSIDAYFLLKSNALKVGTAELKWTE